MDIRDIRTNLSEVRNTIELVSTSFSELKSLTKERSTLINDVKNDYSVYQKAIINEARKKSHNVRTKVFPSEVNLPFNEKTYDTATVKSLYTLINYINIFNVAKKLVDVNKNLNNDIEDSKIILKNTLSWMVTGKNQKEKAVNAYNSINDVIDSGFIDKVDNLLRMRRSIDANLAEKTFFDNPHVFVDVLNNVIESKVYIENDPQVPNFNVIRKREKQLRSSIVKAQEVASEFDNLKRKTENNAYRLVENETTSILKQIDVEELNREKKGIRTSLLKEAGYKTISDIIEASQYKLSSIYGISENNAYAIKKEAEKIREKTSKTVRIKVSSDNKTEDTTRLLSSVYQFVNYKDLIEVTKKLDETYRNVAERAANLMSIYDDELKWLFASHDEKNNYIENIDQFDKWQLNKYITNIKKVSDIKNRLVNNIGISDTVVWDFFEKNSAKCFTALDELVPGLFGNSDIFYGLPEELAEKIQEECFFPEGLLVTLRRYQEWGVKYILHQKRVLLGDEMGLGKTVQAIASMVSLRNTGENHFLVVCPASVVINWCREIEQHSKLRAIKIHGDTRRLMLQKWIDSGGVGVTTYETVGTLDIPDDFRFSMLTVDEAHYVKNPEARRTKSIINLEKKTRRVLYMTGTALENKVDEMIELISHLQPEIARQVSSLAFMSTAETFRNRVAPVYYRRKREDVLTELPDLIENEAWCELKPQEKEIYEKSVFAKKTAEIRRVSWNVEDLNVSSKAQRLKELLVEIKEEGRKVIVFSFFLDTIRKIHDYFSDVCLPPITGSLSPAKRQEVIDEFDKADAGSMLICQIQAGGTGLNIQSASVVVITEPQWKPSIENQAISRAYRMGQTRNVLVYRLLCENTVDERLIRLLKSKQEVFDTFADISVAAEANREIDEKTFGNIIKEEIDRINAEKAGKVNVNQEGGE